jgi:CRP-like cAMP-binding protein
MQPTSTDSAELLGGTGLAAGMTPEQVQVLARWGKQEVYGDGDKLIDWDDTEFDLLLVLDGKCEIRTKMNDVQYRQGRDSLIGEMSFLDHKPRSAKAVAVGECKILRFPASLLDDLDSDRTDIAAKLLKNIGLVVCMKLRSTTRFAEAGFV